MTERQFFPEDYKADAPLDARLAYWSTDIEQNYGWYEISDDAAAALRIDLDAARAAIAALEKERDGFRKSFTTVAGKTLAFTDFVLRHTFPERARAHGFETVYSLILNHPVVKDQGIDRVTAQTE